MRLLLIARTLLMLLQKNFPGGIANECRSSQLASTV
jgi:hypothetical protein